MRTFKEIGKNLTDKVWKHHYDRFYPLFLEHLRGSEFNMAEIGLGVLGSYKLWKEYFPKANIWGVDIQQIEYTDKRLTLIQADQSNKNGIEKISQSIPKDCALIIDDGSHVAEHQIKTFHKLFAENIKPGGVYIIEDIECSYWRDEAEIYGYKTGPFSTVSHFKNLLESINRPITGVTNTLNIGTITFAYNSIIVTKSTDEYLDSDKVVYEFSRHLK